MKVVNEIKSGSNGESPQAGCVCNSGWKSTRGPWQPTFLCNCNCISAILDTIKSETKKKISIIIMHRFNYMVRCADKIVVLKNGEITEMGTHEQLVEKKGLYNDGDNSNVLLNNDLYYMHLEINSKDKVYDMG